MKTRLYTTCLILLSACVFSFNDAKAQQALQVSSTERFIAYSLYNFSKLIKWPNSGTVQTFQIAVVGDKSVYNELSYLAKNKKVGNANYQITFYKDIADVQNYNHIVYLSASQSLRVAELGSDLEGVLVVTERDGLSSQGSTISFTTDAAGKMGFEIAKENAMRNQLTIHGQLERMAINIL